MSAGFLEPVAHLAGLVLMAECFFGREEVPVRFWCSALITHLGSCSKCATEKWYASCSIDIGYMLTRKE